MLPLTLLALALVQVPVPAPVQPAAPAATGERIPLKVLYAGLAGTPREQAFTSFLREHFATVASVPAEELKERAGAFDVVVADGLVEDQGENSIRMLGATREVLPAGWSKATVLVGSAGKAAEEISKIGWL
jgi:hypothetical protein